MSKDSLYQRVIEVYRRTGSVKSTAETLGTTLVRAQRILITEVVEPEFGKSKLVDLKRTDVRGFYNYLADERHVKVNTIDNIHTVLHQVLELGVEDDYLRYNPSDNA